ncbi:response regulator [Aquimarina agarilytica]|uniref:response regulator n=1 Tax=Aquimarina agarilytica TaxID=1087449 RepID=UPI0002883C28|nr:response regulator [Aquimarina agarilytica]
MCESPRINCVLLVDDNPSTNFLNKKTITATGLVKTINVATNGVEALDYIHKRGKFKDKNCPKSNIIFLDINMPKMGGFEFLEHYEKLDEELKADIVIVFLTTSNWEKDKLKAYGNGFINDYIEKPLLEEKFIEIYNSYIENKVTT